MARSDITVLYSYLSSFSAVCTYMKCAKVEIIFVNIKTLFSSSGYLKWRFLSFSVLVFDTKLICWNRMQNSQKQNSQNSKVSLVYNINNNYFSCKMKQTLPGGITHDWMCFFQKYIPNISQHFQIFPNIIVLKYFWTYTWYKNIDFNSVFCSC